MSCCEGTSGGLERYPGTGCCGTSCAAGKTGCSASEPRIRSCFCQENVGCLDRADCGGFRPRGTAATGACPGPCQCVEEEAWNRIVPPKPNCEWLTNFSELRRQWSDHGRQNNCKCCNCKPCRTAAPCRPCLPPAPTCSTAEIAPDNCQDCCNVRLSGGACGQPLNSPPPRRRDCSPPMYSSGGCPPPSCNSTSSSTCPPNAYPSPCSSPSDCSIPNPCTTSCRPPTSCQPCSPSPRPILKKRSCCQCITGYCMCQPMPRNCNCPPPVQVDARAERECSCDCPSSPECACPPSERRFPRTKVKCPNARLCCPTPRPQPGPKCCCTKCQPCLPPPCDPCTSSKCCTVLPKVKPCCGDSPCSEMSPCRPDPSRMSVTECRPTPPCVDCQKMSPPCRPPHLGSVASGSRPGSRQMRLLNQSRQPVPRCDTPSGVYRSPGQSWNRLERCDNTDEREFVSRAEGFDGDGGADLGKRGAQCHCGPPGSRGCDRECDYCCSLGCDDVYSAAESVYRETMSIDEVQCRCGNSINHERTDCANDCDHCCSADCHRGRENFDVGLLDREQCGCGSDGKICAESCDYCCSRNCDSTLFDSHDGNVKAVSETAQRIAAGGAENYTGAENNSHTSVPRSVTWKESGDLSEIFKIDSSCKTSARWSGTPLVSMPGLPNNDVCDGVVPTVGRAQPVYTSSYSPSSSSPCTVCKCDSQSEPGGSALLSCLEEIGRSILLPGPLALVSFILLILVGLSWAFGLALYHRYNCVKKHYRLETDYRNAIVASSPRELGGRLNKEIQSGFSQTSLSSVIINSQNITSYHFPGYGVRPAQWIGNEAEMQRNYSAVWLLLPVGSIFITALVVLLMVMFNRCPQMIAAVVTGILGIIIVFIILMSLDHKPVYS